ncbi:MAG: epoxide hydrolase, partial [Candidatus Cybelea sp.]
MTQGAQQSGSDLTAIRPFPKLNVPEAELDDLRRRIKATRWPTKELVADDSQGVQLATMQALAAYWADGYDWRKIEAKLNATPQFVTQIDGVDIQFIHVRSKHDNALPLIITHGWPGSIIEQMKVIGPLTDPAAHGASASDAFHLVIPSIPGYGYSAEPAALGWDPVRIAKAWVALMQRLGYDRFVAQGGDWGAAVTQQLAIIAPDHVMAIHSNMPGTVPDDILTKAIANAPPPAGLAGDELNAYRQLADFYTHHLGYAVEMANRPQTLYALNDSPIGLAAWILDH